MSDSDREHRARLYTAERGRTILNRLGIGTDGSVWQTTRSTAVKACEDPDRYSTERDCYRLFRDKGIVEIHEFAVPRLIDFSDELMVIEMDMVKPPCILDFGKACIGSLAYPYTNQMVMELYAARKPLFEHEWPKVLSALSLLRGYGVWHLDPRPYNIQLANWNPSIDADMSP